ncbi:MAG: 30S ribosome-binding factor RbfA [Candidatus Colwellbacteria bacterium]|nr:30S ribosome-binding factor RbfA [Candidatus Colwellbacteria bacterium]
MDIKRQPKLESLIEQELSKLIARELDLPSGVLVSLTSVELSSDLNSAKIGVSVFPDGKAVEIVDQLKKSSGGLHYKLIRILNIRTVPQLNFVIDEGVEHAAKIEKKLMDE